ncbi:MAG: putative quinol monooxygenase, partial [Paracoccaceae bacterium]
MANIVIHGTITCEPDDLAQLTEALAEHIRLSRAEPGNIMFDITQSEAGSCQFLVSERFVDRAAFDA